jgi:hypothetical protein
MKTLHVSSEKITAAYRSVDVTDEQNRNEAPCD